MRYPRRSPLRDIAYDRSAAALWRWVDAPQDAALTAFVEEYGKADDPAAVRSRLTPGDFYTLMTFARRCVLAALRTSAPALARTAFEALSAIELDRIDWRDMAVVSSLVSYAARRVGLAPDEVLTGAVLRAEPAVADILRNATTGEGGSGGYHELKTPSGPVLVEISGPVRGAVDLLKRALRVAEAIEADGRYDVSNVAVEREVPAVWLVETPEAATARRRLRRCVSVRAEPPGDRANFLLVFLAEAESEEAAETVASAARRRVMDQASLLGIAAGRRCAVVVARSAVYGEPSIEDGPSLTRFVAPITTVLR
ncbi:hypothetical protein [Actinophytocola sp.]|uniref:hypothetical protein n=1 Tax=Actinophytocola sp. TaxID=1872138 RepID=UPI002ED49035